MKKKLTHIFYFVVIALFLISCNNAPKNENLSENENHELNSEKSNNCDSIHWSHHDGKEGPENWKNLCDGFTSCGGHAQSPINITTNEATKNSELTPFKFNYNTTNVDIINNGHTVQFNTFGNNSIFISNKEYKLLQFHYHAKSEHTIDGEHYPIEVHFVHKHSDMDYAVLGMMFQEGEDNELFTEFLSQFPAKKGKFESEKLIELKKLLPSDLSYYYYKGSLTTPPCSEVVSWYVLKSPLKASKEQIEKFSEILHNNFRPLMPLNDRKVFSFNE